MIVYVVPFLLPPVAPKFSKSVVFENWKKNIKTYIFYYNIVKKSRKLKSFSSKYIP